MTVVTVNCGNCNFIARIEVDPDAEGDLQVRIASDCPRVREFADQVQTLGATCAAGWKCAHAGVFAQAAAANLHPACPVATALLKACEVAARLALPQDVTIHFEE